MWNRNVHIGVLLNAIMLKCENNKNSLMNRNISRNQYLNILSLYHFSIVSLYH